MAVELICKHTDSCSVKAGCFSSAASIVLTVVFGMGLDFVRLLGEKTFGKGYLSQF